MFKKSIIKLALASSFLLPLGVLPKEAIASGTRRISTSDAQGLNGRAIELSIHSGYGLTLDFFELDEIIVDATLADPSNFTFSGLVGNLCPKFAPVQCEGNGARGIRIGRMSKPIKFEQISSSPNGQTVLTLVTQGRNGMKVYKFILKKGQGNPPFNHVKITADPEKTPLTLSNESLTEEELNRARQRWIDYQEEAPSSLKENCKPRKIRVAVNAVTEKSCD